MGEQSENTSTKYMKKPPQKSAEQKKKSLA